MNCNSVLSTSNLLIGYGNTPLPAGKDLNLQLFAGRITCLLGANGAGKSTLLRTLGRLQKPLAGSIILQNKPIEAYTSRQLASRIGLVLTSQNIDQGLTVEQVTQLGRYPYTNYWGQLGKEDHEIVNRVMQEAGIAHKATCRIANLSDGERQKAMLAKCMAQQSSIILLDEPSSFLDMPSRTETAVLLQRLAKEKNIAVLLSTHEIETAFAIADFIWLMTETGVKSMQTEDLLLSLSGIPLFKSSSTQKDIFVAFNNGKIQLQTAAAEKGKKFFINAEEPFYSLLHNYLNRKGYSRADKKHDADIYIDAAGNSLKTLISVTENNRHFQFASFLQMEQSGVV